MTKGRLACVGNVYVTGLVVGVVGAPLGSISLRLCVQNGDPP